MIQHRSLASRFRTILLLIALIPMVFFGVVSYFQIRTTAIRKSESSVRALANNKHAMLVNWMNDQLQRKEEILHIAEISAFLEHNGSSPSRGSGTEYPAQRLTLALQSRLGAGDDIMGIFILSPDGNLLYSFV